MLLRPTTRCRFWQNVPRSSCDANHSVANSVLPNRSASSRYRHQHHRPCQFHTSTPGLAAARKSKPASTPAARKTENDNPSSSTNKTAPKGTSRTAAWRTKFRNENVDLSPAGVEPLPHLPDESTWKHLLHKRSMAGSLYANRYFVRSKETTQRIIEALQLDKQRKGTGEEEKLTILEGYPGPGTLTQAFLASDDVGRVIAIEDEDCGSAKVLENLREFEPGAKGRLEINNGSAFHWETYTQILSKGLLDHIPRIRDHRDAPRQQDRDNMFQDQSWIRRSPVLFFAQLPNSVHSEQLLTQLIRCISERQWLFRFLRIRMAFVCSQHIAHRCLAEPGDRLRGKLTHLAQSFCNVEMVMDPSAFEPYQDHFWPPKASVGRQLPVRNRGDETSNKRKALMSLKAPLCLLTIEPKEDPFFQGDEIQAFDYLTNHLFIFRTSNIGKALTHLAPGAPKLLDVIKEGKHPALKGLVHVKISPDESIRDLSIEQVAALVRVFERWPFRPNYFQGEAGDADVVSNHEV